MTRITYAAYAFRPDATRAESLENALQIATLTAAVAHSSFFHTSMVAYERVVDCAHPAPDADGQEFEDMRDIPFVDLASDERYPAYKRALDDYEQDHYDDLCHLTPLGTFCPECAGRIDDVDPAECERRLRALDARDEFWDAVSMRAEALLPVANLPVAA